MITAWKGKNVAVLGAGVEGLSSAVFLAEKGAKISLRDQQEIIDKDILKQVQHDNIDFLGGTGYLANLDQYEIIVRSPGIKRNLPELLVAEKKGSIITSQTKLFFDLCPAPIIGVTGTKGKGTTSSLIYEMLKAEGLDVYLGGNIGVPPLTFLEKLTLSSWVVLELSSFQLFDLTKSPHIGVLLMITNEHQDYHEDVIEYVDAKRNLVRYQTTKDFAVINRDYPASHESDIHTDGQIFQVSTERAVDSGCFIRDGKVILRKLGKTRKSSVSDNSEFQKVRFSGSLSHSESSGEEVIVDIKDILLPGRHNLENVCAAVMSATLAGVSKKSIQTVLQSFQGLEHRLQLISEVRGVRYYDDSFSTTPETAIAAIEAFDVPEVLILGGSKKQSDFTELGKLLSTRVNIRAIIGIGVEWPEIKSKINNEKLKVVEGCKTMQEVVKKASEIAQPGDVVLLSPACASFDMFKNYKDRGEQFAKEVQSL